MDQKINGKNADYLKRKAKNLSKSLGVSHITALNIIAKDLNYSTWEDFITNSETIATPKVTLRKPKVPDPPVLNYRGFITGNNIGQHPNKKMPVKRHAQVGSLLQEILEEVEYHKRAKNAVQEIRRIMDTWLGCEYNQEELANAEFNQIYYGGTYNLDWKMPTKKRQEQLKRMLRKAKSVIDCNYHDCKPLDKLHIRFDIALTSLEKWPKNIKAPGLNRFKGQLRAGTFVRLDKNKQIGIVFNHNPYSQTIEGYTNSGRFLAGRHEISVLRKQLELSEFKPMRLYLPYGKWTCADGSEVLFNRDYCPIWEKSIEGNITTIDPGKYVSHEKSEYYFNDRTAPYYNGNLDTFNSCFEILKQWGVNEKPNLILQILPTAIEAKDLRLLSPKGIS